MEETDILKFSIVWELRPLRWITWRLRVVTWIYANWHATTRYLVLSKYVRASGRRWFELCQLLSRNCEHSRPNTIVKRQHYRWLFKLFSQKKEFEIKVSRRNW